MRPPRGILMALFALSIASCWTGRPFYSGADAVQPIRPGLYRIVAQFPPQKASGGDTEAPVRIGAGAGGTTVIEDKDDPDALFLVKLPGAPDRYVAQDAERTGPDDVAIFWLYAIDGDTVRISLPSCDRTYRIARKAGAVVARSASGRECRFPDRASLEAAMTRYARRPDNWTEIARVGD